MKKLVIGLALAASMASTAAAQQPLPRTANLGQGQDQQINLTPEMLLYLQAIRRHDDPQQAVRRNAEQKASERRSRLAAMKWYGFSNQRPQASPVPYYSSYSPAWAGNSWDPYRWRNNWYPQATLRIDYPLSR